MILRTAVFLFSLCLLASAQENEGAPDRRFGNGVAAVESEFLLKIDVMRLLANTKQPKWPEGVHKDGLDDLNWERQVIKDYRIKISHELHTYDTKYRWSPDGEKCYVMGKFNEMPIFDHVGIVVVDTSLYRLDKIRASQASLERIRNSARDYARISNYIEVKQEEAFILDNFVEEGPHPVREAEFMKYRNKTVFEATQLATEEGYQVRILSIDETFFMQTMDIRDDRLNFTVRYGIVIRAVRG